MYFSVCYGVQIVFIFLLISKSGGAKRTYRKLISSEFKKMSLNFLFETTVNLPRSTYIYYLNWVTRRCCTCAMNYCANMIISSRWQCNSQVFSILNDVAVDSIFKIDFFTRRQRLKRKAFAHSIGSLKPRKIGLICVTSVSMQFHENRRKLKTMMTHWKEINVD